MFSEKFSESLCILTEEKNVENIEFAVLLGYIENRKIFCEQEKQGFWKDGVRVGKRKEKHRNEG